jgi:hypothetical protein
MSEYEVLLRVRQRLTLARFQRWLERQALDGRRKIGRSCSGWSCPLSLFLAEEVGQPVYVGRTRVFLSEPVQEEELEEMEQERWEGEEEGVELPEWARMVVDWVDLLGQGQGQGRWLRLEDVQMIVGEVRRELEARRW